MKKISNELLLSGCLCFFVFKLAFLIDFLAYEKHLLPFNPLNPFFLFWFGVSVLVYNFLTIIFSLQLCSNALIDYPRILYYLKAVGWIPFAYLIGFGIYFCCDGTYLHFWLEKTWNNYPLSNIILLCSLVIAWLRKNHDFLIN